MANLSFFLIVIKTIETGHLPYFSHFVNQFYTRMVQSVLYHITLDKPTFFQTEFEGCVQNPLKCITN